MGRGVDIYTHEYDGHVRACIRVNVLKFGYQETINHKASVPFVSKTSFFSSNDSKFRTFSHEFLAIKKEDYKHYAHATYFRNFSIISY